MLNLQKSSASQLKRECRVVTSLGISWITNQPARTFDERMIRAFTFLPVSGQVLPTPSYVVRHD